MVSVLLSASVKRFDVSRMRDFYNIIIKCQNVAKGRGGGSDNVDKDFCMF